MAGVTLRGVRKSFGRIEVIHGVDLEVADGEFVAFVGPSGCGKSTLLRLIAGLEEPGAGDLFIGGQRVNDRPPAARGIAMVFQSYALYPHMTAYDNMAFGLTLSRTDKRTIAERVRAAARLLQIEDLLDRKPRDLSGGQRQRVAIGRAIVREPQVFLFDEPLSNLDAGLRVQMRLEIAKLKADLRATMIYVTHDQVEAMTLADRIVVLNAGRVEQAGTPLELYHHPRNRFVAGFIGSPAMNFLDVVSEGRASGSVRVWLPGGVPLEIPVDGAAPPAGTSLTLGVRPEHVGLAGEGAGLVAAVIAVERLGGETHCHAALEDGQRVLVRLDGDRAVTAGERLRLNLRGETAHLFGSDGQRL
ncbi:ABC transporter ATP-binding protein [Roseomonas genomospecies 6]|uniref:Sn-glycerol-3-phosphate ABC transporter ATP-binding protein UgpC n=1 Tax=Roseomonas genomospecies 6 TaxID=214106 RepID=A0A9W7TYP0_9PROT|nr:sn-glycerol-3-phosphate ABC transporter ATP-binding protein UgpC [Roseomonas genomospecies 6]KAA0680027.1 sn-glycerol-3-phosphate ABC transporter ATP-binding protein UgpC [Roseomonas genomospecies 6]